MSTQSDKQNVAIVFGGASSEYEVSLLSASSVLKNIDCEKYNIYKIGITKDGKMFYYTGSVDRIAENNWSDNDCVPCVISPDRSHHGMIILSDKTEIIRLDVVFPVLHGKNGEDGTIQGLLSMAGIPYVGCNVLSSACCMDKGVTKALLDNAHIDNAKWVSILEHQYRQNPEQYLSQISDTLSFPCFVKPANAGSSVGISKAADSKSLAAAMDVAFQHDKKVIVEEFVQGLEIECAVLGNVEPIASILGEIEPCNDFYDYDAKYLANKTKTYAPARISPEDTERIRSTAIKAYQALGCEGFSRVDFFLCKNGTVILNEINTIPGFTAISMYPQLCEKSGIPYSELIDRLLSLGQNRR